MRITRTAILLALALIAGVGPAAAQVIQPPPRSTGGLFGGRRPVDPNRTSQQLSLTFDFLGGYDDAITPDGQGSVIDPTAPRQSGTTATMAGTLEYQRGRARSGFEATAHSVVATYQGIDVQPLVGGRGTLRGFTQLFERLTVTAWGEMDYRPTFMFGTMGVPPDVETTPPPTDPTGGVTELSTVNGGGGTQLTYDWNVRHHTSGGYTYTRMRSFSPANLDVATQTAVIGHSWEFVRNMRLESSLTLSEQASQQPTGDRQGLDTQTAALGLEVRVPISRTRRLTFSGNGGATRVQTLSAVTNAPIDYTTPSYAGSIRMDLGRTWAMSADFNRMVQMLEGLTLQSFVTTTASVWGGGSVGRRSVLSFTGLYSDGIAHPGESGTYDSFGAIAQWQFRISQCCSVITNYSRYQHTLSEVASVPIGFPRNTTNNSVRVGLTLWLPLFGTFPSDGQPQPQGSRD